jgi:hypothetical protein
MVLTNKHQPLIALTIHVTETLYVRISLVFKELVVILIAITPLIVLPAIKVLNFIAKEVISSLISSIVTPTLGVIQIEDKDKDFIVMTSTVQKETSGVMCNIMVELALILHNLIEG